MFKAKSYFITGTDTNVGKTVITACLLTLYRKHGVDAGVMKPIETGVDQNCSSESNSDAKFLLTVSGNKDPLEEVCPIRLKPATSPLQATRITDQTVDINLILENFEKLQAKHDHMLVEGIGGLLVPLTESYLVSNLIRDMNLPVIIVSRVSLGTINHTLLTVKVAQETGINIAGVIFNHPEDRAPNDIELEQASIIQKFSNVPILGECPFIGSISAELFSNKLEKKIEDWKI